MRAYLIRSVIRWNGVRAAVCLAAVMWLAAGMPEGGMHAAQQAAAQDGSRQSSAQQGMAPNGPVSNGAQGSGTQAVTGSPTPAQNPYSLQLQAPLVLEDVVVLDRNDRPVRGLKASDFSVTEDGKPMDLKNFEEHVAVAGEQTTPAKLPKLGMNVFTNLTPTPVNSAINILLLDALNTPVNDQMRVRQEMLNYLKGMPQGIRIAVFGISTRLFMLQGFTTDHEVLKAAIEGKHGNGSASPLMDDPMSGGPVEQMSDMASETLGTDPDSQELIANMQEFEAETATFQITLREQYTLEAMNELARYLSGLPGRKNLIWVSGSFPINLSPDETLEHPFIAMADYEDDVRQTMDLLAKSQVVVYPVDGRGLFDNPAMSASQSGAQFTNPAVSSTRNPTNPFAQSQRKFFQQTTAEHGTMDMMAETTGGKAFYNTNGLKEAVEKAVNFGSNYYSFSYRPENLKWNGAYRKIVVKTDQPGLRLSYRKGYFADDPEPGKKGPKVLPKSTMQIAMMRGGPDPTQLAMRVMVIPDDATSDKLSDGAQPSAKLMKPPYRNLTMNTVVDLNRVKLTQAPDGTYQGVLEYVAVVYDADGQAVNVTSRRIQVHLPADQYAQLLRQGLRFQFQVDTPAKGEHFLRVGIYDVASDRVGTVEIALSSLHSKQAMIDAQKAAAK